MVVKYIRDHIFFLTFGRVRYVWGRATSGYLACTASFDVQDLLAAFS
jgi:hypothetical protein